MKHLFSIALIAVIFTGLAGCRGDDSGSGQGSFGREGSYAFGMYLGSDLASGNLGLNIDEFVQGLRDALTGSRTRFSVEEAAMIVQQAFFALDGQQEEGSRDVEDAFLAENSRRPGIISTESGLQYEIISEGSGEKPLFEDTVLVHYTGTLLDGTVFDTSHDRGEPTQFPLAGVITGWTEGLQLMSVGSNYRFFIPSDLAYGPRGAGQQIPPYSTLIFDVELIDILRD